MGPQLTATGVRQIVSSMVRDTWPRSLLWLAVGLLEAHIVAACVIIFEAVAVLGIPIGRAMYDLPYATFYFSVAAVASTLVAAPVLWLWARLVRRHPRMEASRLRMLLGLVGLSVVLSLLVGALSSWENLLNRSGLEASFIKQTLEIARIVGPWILVGLVLPRFTIPALRAGNFGVRPFEAHA